jgi:hypothetical protein
MGYETFEDVNSNPEIANTLRHLYEHPDYIELYPGIVISIERMALGTFRGPKELATSSVARVRMLTSSPSSYGQAC